MKNITFRKEDFSDKELHKIWRVLCQQGIRNDVTWVSNAKKLDTVTILNP